MMQDEQTIPYARPAGHDGPRVWAGAAIVFSGLSLIVLGGCFLIGMMMIVNPLAFGFAVAAPVHFTWGQAGMLALLGLLATGCFGCAVMLLVRGLRGLFRILNHR